jgi:hypothetical protein
MRMVHVKHTRVSRDRCARPSRGRPRRIGSVQCSRGPLVCGPRGCRRLPPPRSRQLRPINYSPPLKRLLSSPPLHLLHVSTSHHLLPLLNLRTPAQPRRATHETVAGLSRGRVSLGASSCRLKCGIGSVSVTRAAEQDRVAAEGVEHRRHSSLAS